MTDDRYNVACKPLGTVPNAPIAYNMGKEIQAPIMIILAMRGGQIQRERESSILLNSGGDFFVVFPIICSHLSSAVEYLVDLSLISFRLTYVAP